MQGTSGHEQALEYIENKVNRYPDVLSPPETKSVQTKGHRQGIITNIPGRCNYLFGCDEGTRKLIAGTQYMVSQAGWRKVEPGVA